MAKVFSKRSTGENSSELVKVIQINEYLKHVIRISMSINLIALNAMLISRRSKADSSGYNVVSVELREFSQRLSLHTQELREMIFRMVHFVAIMKKKIHFTSKYEIILKKHEKAGAISAVVLKKLRDDIKGIQATTHKESRKLLRHTDFVLKLCEMGSSIYRNARVEAAYVSDLTSELMIVADTIENSVNEILDLLHKVVVLIEDY